MPRTILTFPFAQSETEREETLKARAAARTRSKRTVRPSGIEAAVLADLFKVCAFVEFGIDLVDERGRIVHRGVEAFLRFEEVVYCAGIAAWI